MSATVCKPSMNACTETDPFNNTTYGSVIDTDYKLVSLPVLDVRDFNERVVRGYEEGWGERDPYNNNCYGTLVDSAYKVVSLKVLDVNDFNERFIRGYE